MTRSIGTFITDFTPQQKALSDLDILDLVKGGEKEYFEILVRRYNERLYRIARSYLKDEVEVEDAMQECYIKAFEKLHQFEGKSRFSTWLTRILINTALAKLNSSKKFSQINLEKLLIDEDDHFQQLIMEQSHEQKIVQKNVSNLLESAIDHLPKKYRVVFMMRAVEKISLADTAEILEISSENVKVRLFRAKKLLRSYLSETITEVDLFGFYLERCDRITQAVLKGIGALREKL